MPADSAGTSAVVDPELASEADGWKTARVLTKAIPSFVMCFIIKEGDVCKLFRVCIRIC